MGSPSLRTFRNRIDRAEMAAASLMWGWGRVLIRQLLQVTEAGRPPGHGKARSLGRQAPMPSLTSSAL